MSKKMLSFSAILLLSLGLFCGCGANDPISRSGFYFDTIITVTLYDASKENVLEGCFDLAGQYENYFSNTLPDSDISKINAAGGTPVTVHDETIELLEKGISYGKLSDGAFDITIGKLSDLWDISLKALLEETDTSMVPSEAEIAEALSTIDYTCIKIDGNEVTLTNPDAKIDLGGIAKGYIADRIKEYLLEQGVESALINLGGNVLTVGEKTDGSPFTIGIQYPFREDGSSIASVQVADKTVVSSGIYERYFEVENTLYHHILDPHTGYPYSNNLLGVTIVTKNSVDGDALSTICFALGLEEGITFIENTEGTEALFITDDYEIHTTSGMGTEVPFKKF